MNKSFKSDTNLNALLYALDNDENILPIKVTNVGSFGILQSAPATVSVSNGTLRVTIGDPSLTVTISNPTLKVTFSDPSLMVTVTNPTLKVTFSDPSLSVTITNPTLNIHIGNPSLSVTMTNPVTSITVSNGTLNTHIGDPSLSVTNLNAVNVDKTETSVIVQAWTAVAMNAIDVSASTSIAGSKETTMEIAVGLSSITAHTGTQIVPQVSPTATGNTWYDLQGYISCVGTAVTMNISAPTVSAGMVTIKAVDTTGFTTYLHRLIKAGTLANSELVRAKASLSTRIVLETAVDNQHIAGEIMYSIADKTIITIPGTYKRARVVVDNTYDSDGSKLQYMMRISKVLTQ